MSGLARPVVPPDRGDTTAATAGTIGLLLRKSGSRVIVAGIVPDGPVARGGGQIQINDELLCVDHTSVGRMPIAQVVQLLRGSLHSTGQSSKLSKLCCVRCVGPLIRETWGAVMVSVARTHGSRTSTLNILLTRSLARSPNPVSQGDQGCSQMDIDMQHELAEERMMRAKECEREKRQQEAQRLARAHEAENKRRKAEEEELVRRKQEQAAARQMQEKEEDRLRRDEERRQAARQERDRQVKEEWENRAREERERKKEEEKKKAHREEQERLVLETEQKSQHDDMQLAQQVSLRCCRLKSV